MRRPLLLFALAALILAPGPHLLGQLTSPLDQTTLSQFRWRPIGPANFSGRISDVEGIPSPSKTFFVAAAAGGIWKTTNNGTTFRPLFTGERVVSMGDIAIAPSDTLQIWAGTGEESSRNSISPGGGIYKSTDGGLTWELKGLEETEIIGRIVVHPTNPDRVWVAAVGKTWASNPERGLYRTDDGGETWQLVKFISDKAGFVEVAIHPRNPDVLFAASWERVRGPYFLQSGGPGSALWKTTDGGDTWTKVEGGGWPAGLLGRIGLSISLSHPDIVYALVEAENAPDGARQSGLYRSDDGGRTWDYRNGNNVRPFYYSQVRVHPTNPDRVYWSSTPVNVSNDGGRTVGTATNRLHVDHHAMWIDPVDPERMIVGNDGGVGVTFDQGGNYIFPNTMPLGQFYEVSYGMEIPYTVCGGLQDNGTWCGPSRRRQGGITNYMWRTVGGGDGFFTLQDPERPEIIYQESQGGNMGRVNTLTGERMALPRPGRGRGGGGQQAEGQAAQQETWLFNWNTPMVLSPHDRTVLYAAGNRVLKYTNMGEAYEVISGDLTYADPEKIRISTQTTGGITRDATGAETFGTIVALAESPLQKGFLFAGTDDGRTWISRSDGGDWEELTDRFPGVPAGTYVRRIEPSSHDVNTFFVAFDGHRNSDFAPYLYLTQDGGRTFRSIAGNLPAGGPDFIHVIRQDLRNPDLLFVGTDVAVYVSTDMGLRWQRFMEGLPTVPVHDLKIHPRDRELIAGTHGRSIWIVDIAPLQEMTDQVMAAEAHLFEPRPGLQYGNPPIGGESPGQMFFQVPSPAYGAEIVFRVGGSGEDRRGGPGVPRSQAEITILDAAGEVVHNADTPATPGIHRYMWNFRRQAPAAPPPPKTEEQLQDSLRAVERVRELVDSMVAAGGDRDMLERTREMLLSGNLQGMAAAFGGAAMGGAGPRAAADPLAFVERPAENWNVAQRGGGTGVFTPEMQVIIQAAQAITGGGGVGRGAGFGGGMGGAGQGPLAEDGEYTVILKIGERELRQTFTLIRGPDAGGG
jgi:photosystem II stability/assembly factor-like uncharacterized protein